MVIIHSKEEKELIQSLRGLVGNPVEQAQEAFRLQKQVNDLKLEKENIKEDHAREERELRHMIGLEKKRQEFETKKATEEATLKVREENLKADKSRFEENLKFNTERFEKMESYLKEMMKNILDRLPNVNVELNRGSRK